MNRTNTKKELVTKLFELVRMTRAGSDTVGMELQEDENCSRVIIQYENGRRIVDVTADSGIALVRDVLKYI